MGFSVYKIIDGNEVLRSCRYEIDRGCPVIGAKYHELPLEALDRTSEDSNILLQAAACDYIRSVWCYCQQALYFATRGGAPHCDPLILDVKRETVTCLELPNEEAIRETTRLLDATFIIGVRKVLNCFFKNSKVSRLAMSLPDGKGAFAIYHWRKEEPNA